MSHYRDLNKELVEQVQTMRKNMKLYCDEIVLLKGELMQKHESEVFLRKQCYNWAVKSFLQLIQSVQPDSEILPILLEHTQSEQRIFGISSCSTERRHPCRGRRSVHRRSSLITRELQRSNSIVNLRKSLCNTSPIRRSSNEASDEEQEEPSPLTRQNNIEEIESAEFADNEATENEVYPIRQTDVGYIIFEETDELDEENDESLEVESVYDSDEEVAVDITEKRNTLNDITNSIQQSIKITSPQPKNQNFQKKPAKKRGRPRKIKSNNKENSSGEYTTANEDGDVYNITKKQIEIRQKKMADKSSENIQEEDEQTLQEPRRYNNSGRNFDTNKSFQLNQSNCQITNNEVTVNSLTLVLNDMTLKNFQNAACSTPNSRQNSLEGTATSNKCESVQTSSNTSTRPSRHCKPKNLTEPQLGKKMRNEKETKSKRKRNTSKPKSKTNNK